MAARDSLDYVACLFAGTRRATICRPPSDLTDRRSPRSAPGGICDCAREHFVPVKRDVGLRCFCLGVGALFESLSLRSGFPFGHYYFTTVMGPKLFQIPILLVLAYLGIGYCSWVLSVLISGSRSKPLAGPRLLLVPALASVIMLAWDLSMKADWSTVDRAWIWRDGGAFFGVPVSNFFGWYFTTYVFYVAFAFYCKAWPVLSCPSSRSYWRAPIVLYGICALGNLLIIRLPTAPPNVTDAAGRHWTTSNILTTCALISLLVMVPMAVLAWHRLEVQAANVGADNSRSISGRAAMRLV